MKMVSSVRLTFLSSSVMRPILRQWLAYATLGSGLVARHALQQMIRAVFSSTRFGQRWRPAKILR
jgi:hypothetical protein